MKAEVSIGESKTGTIDKNYIFLLEEKIAHPRWEKLRR